MSEFCDCCGELVSRTFERETAVTKYHFHQNINGRIWTMCVKCVFKRMRLRTEKLNLNHAESNIKSTSWAVLSLSELIHGDWE